MRELIFGTILVGAAGAGAWFIPFGAGDRPDYAMSVSEAKQLLAHADLRKGQYPFGRLEVLVTSPSQNVVRYEAGGTFAALDCKAQLEPVEGGIDVATGCTRAAASDGAASSAAGDITDLAFAEYVASVLGKRPFNDAKMNAQATGAVFRNLPQMQHDALKMQREMSQNTAGSGSDSGAEYVPDDAAADDGSAQYEPDQGDW